MASEAQGPEPDSPDNNLESLHQTLEQIAQKAEDRLNRSHQRFKILKYIAVGSPILIPVTSILLLPVPAIGVTVAAILGALSTAATLAYENSGLRAESEIYIKQLQTIRANKFLIAIVNIASKDADPLETKNIQKVKEYIYRPAINDVLNTSYESGYLPRKLGQASNPQEVSPSSSPTSGNQTSFLRNQ
jgi:hypothetical protein